MIGGCDSCVLVASPAASPAATVAFATTPAWAVPCFVGFLAGLVVGALAGIAAAWRDAGNRGAPIDGDLRSSYRGEQRARRDHVDEWDQKYSYAMDKATKARWPQKTTKDWEIWLTAAHRAAMAATKPFDDGTFGLVPPLGFPPELIPRLREFGFRLASEHLRKGLP
jgi:hypothetical protein